MAGRIRTIKPEWAEDEKMLLASPCARVLSVALIIEADDYGNGRANETLMMSRIFPGYAEKAQGSLGELKNMDFLVLYTVRGQSYFAIRNWELHQKVSKPGKPRVPGICEAETVDSADPVESPGEFSNTHADHDHDLDHDLIPTTTTRDPEKGGQGVLSLKTALGILGSLPDDSAKFREDVEECLRCDGWSLTHEVPVSDRGDGRGGFVDLVASKDGFRVGIELDARTPRKKSITKLLALGIPAVVILRGKWAKPTPHGLMAVIGISVAPKPSSTPELRKVHGETARMLWTLQERLRCESIPGSRSLTPDDERLGRIYKLLGGGVVYDDCVAVLQSYADEAKRNPASAKWFNGETHWIKKNFDRCLGGIGSAAPQTTGQAKPMARNTYTETGKQELK